MWTQEQGRQATEAACSRGMGEPVSTVSSSIVLCMAMTRQLTRGSPTETQEEAQCQCDPGLFVRAALQWRGEELLPVCSLFEPAPCVRP